MTMANGLNEYVNEFKSNIALILDNDKAVTTFKNECAKLGLPEDIVENRQDATIPQTGFLAIASRRTVQHHKLNNQGSVLAA